MCSQRFFRGPAYLRVRDLLAQKIAAGEWNAGKELPSESVLARQFGVSCGTVRSALLLLERQCAIVRKRGNTFVAVDADHREIHVAYPEVGSSGMLREIECLPAIEEWADEIECVRLHLSPTDRVFRTRRVHFSKGTPFMAERIAHPAALFPGLSGETLPSRGILDLASIHGIALGLAHEHASIAAASPGAAEALGIEDGSLILMLDRVVTAQDGSPAEWRVAECSLAAQHLLSISKSGGGSD
jgi:GntR family transcriptional regulator